MEDLKDKQNNLLHIMNNLTEDQVQMQ